ncbi:unnamed protein product [Rotaria sp. Silwood1]|nr:unnamed protein product [Rotaria sp. Silwood1]
MNAMSLKVCFIIQILFFQNLICFYEFCSCEQKRYTFKSFKDEVASLAASLLELSCKKTGRFAVWLPDTSENVCSIKIRSYQKHAAKIYHNKLHERQASVNLDSFIAIFYTSKHAAKIYHNKLHERQASVNLDSFIAIFYTSSTIGHLKATTLTSLDMVNMSKCVTDHFGKCFTRLSALIPMFHIFSEVQHEEKCTAMIGVPIIFRDILDHPDRKKYDLSSLVYYGLVASPMNIDFLRRLEKEIPIKCIGQLFELTENVAILTSSDESRIEDEGYLYYNDRQKELITRSGVNIYQIEIENANSERPSVAESQVFSFPDTCHDDEVCA